MSYELTSSRAVRAAFWRENPQADRKRVPHYSGRPGVTMYCTDTRCDFANWLDTAQKNGRLSQRLAYSVTLDH